MARAFTPLLPNNKQRPKACHGTALWSSCTDGLTVSQCCAAQPSRKATHVLCDELPHRATTGVDHCHHQAAHHLLSPQHTQSARPCINLRVKAAVERWAAGGTPPTSPSGQLTAPEAPPGPAAAGCWRPLAVTAAAAGGPVRLLDLQAASACRICNQHRCMRLVPLRRLVQEGCRGRHCEQQQPVREQQMSAQIATGCPEQLRCT